MLVLNSTGLKVVPIASPYAQHHSKDLILDLHGITHSTVGDQDGDRETGQEATAILGRSVISRQCPGVSLGWLSSLVRATTLASVN